MPIGVVGSKSLVLPVCKTTFLETAVFLCPNSTLSREREARQLFCNILFQMFHSVPDSVSWYFWHIETKENDFRVSWDAQAKYKIIS